MGNAPAEVKGALQSLALHAQRFQAAVSRAEAAMRELQAAHEAAYPLLHPPEKMT